jgi:hypothetical protein
MSLNNINLYNSEEFCSLCVSPNYLDYNISTNKNKKMMKSRDKSEEKKDKTISKMLAKKVDRYVDKKYKNNIKRKTMEYSF